MKENKKNHVENVKKVLLGKNLSQLVLAFLGFQEGFYYKQLNSDTNALIIFKEKNLEILVRARIKRHQMDQKSFFTSGCD